MISKRYLTIALIAFIIPFYCVSINAQDVNEDSYKTKLQENLEQMARQLEQKLPSMSEELPELNVVDQLGAINNGREITTAQIQSGVDSCFNMGGGILVFPKGMYLTGTIILKSGVHIMFEDGARLIGSTKPEDFKVIYPDYKNNTDRQVNKSLFYAEHVENISITGKGIIDFNGDAPEYLNSGNNDPRRPFGIRIVSSKNIYVSDVMLMNSPQWMQHYLNCENLMIENINVFNHAHKNNDGMDIDGCKNVYVRKCQVDSDDDAICLKSNGPSPCENVLIEDCIASSHCNALKLGTETTGGFINVMYRNCKVVPSVTGEHHVNGVSSARTAITLIITDGGLMQNVWFDNIDATNCITPLYVTLGNRSRRHTDSAPKPDIGAVENILISNFKATVAGPITSSVTGLDTNHPIKNFKLKNIHFSLSHAGIKTPNSVDLDDLFTKKKSKYPSSHNWDHLPSAGIYFRFIDGLILQNVNIDNWCNDPRKLLMIKDCDRLVKK